jgi:hypothetical protein
MPNKHGNNHRPSSVLLEKAQLEQFNEMSACYEKYESILGQVHIPFDMFDIIVEYNEQYRSVMYDINRSINFNSYLSCSNENNLFTHVYVLMYFSI